MKKSSGLIDTVLGIYENVFLPMLLRRADGIATVYPEFIEQKLHAADKSKIFYAPPCIDPAIFYPSTGKPKPARVPTLLFVGRIEHSSDWKGLDVLLEAVQKTTSIPELRLQVVGAGDAVDDYRQRSIELGIAERVTFVGKLEGSALADAYRGATALVLPSKSDAEAFGTVLIESMACGTPVIASRIGGVPNVIKATEGGILVEPGDSDALAAAIQSFVGNTPERLKVAKKGMETVHNNFVWQSTTTRYVEHITALTVKRQPAIIQLTPYFPPHLGGMENVVQEISEELAVRGHDVTVITSDVANRADFTEKTALKDKVKRLHTLEIAHLPIIWSLPLQLLRTPRRSIFHVHIAQAFFPELTLLVAKLKHDTFIAHFHLDVTTSGAFGFIFSVYKKTLFPLMLRSADSVIVFSEAQKQLVITKYGVRPERAAIIPNGVRVADYMTERIFTADGKQLLYVGRLSPQKRLDRLIEAMQYLPKDVKLDIVGSGETQASLVALAEQLELDSVTFHGPKTGAALISAYKTATMFVLPSDREGMPLVLLEAMAAGLPIVASDVVGNHELVQDVGVLVPAPYEPKQFASAITAGLKKKQLQTLSARSYEEAQKYSWKVLVTTLEDLYIKVRP